MTNGNNTIVLTALYNDSFGRNQKSLLTIICTLLAYLAHQVFLKLLVFYRFEVVLLTVIVASEWFMSCLEIQVNFILINMKTMSIAYWLYVLASYSDNSISSDEDDGVSPREKEQVLS